MNKRSLLPINSEAAIAEAHGLPEALQHQSAALIIAHPGHELRLHGWLALARPRVYVLTDGSGHTRRSRLEATTRLIEAVGAEPGCIYGRFTDSEFYALLLNQQIAQLTELVSQLAEDLTRKRIGYVVGDAIEGYNPTHDVCRLLINAAVTLAARATRQPIANYEFAVVGHADAADLQAIRLHLDERAFADKLAAARAYSEWMSDVDLMLNDAGAESFRVETLRPATDDDDSRAMAAEPPFYEHHGEKQVAAGYYRDVLRHRQHILPIAAALRDYAEQHR